MSNYVIRDTACLFDPATGQWVGVIDSNGAEHVVVPPGGKVVTSSTSAQGVVISAGDSTFGIKSAYPDTPFGGVPVGATNSQYPDAMYTTVICGTSINRWKANRPSAQLRIVCISQQSGVHAPSTDVTVKASIEVDNKTGINSGDRILASWGGRETGAVSPFSIITSDPINAPVVKDQYFWTRVFSAGWHQPYKFKNLPVPAWGEGGNHVAGDVGADLTETGTMTPNTKGAYGPLTVVGDDGIGYPYVVIDGDSNSNGTGDDPGANPTGRGFMHRLLGSEIPFLNKSFDGRQALADHTSQRILCRGATDVFFNLGINDTSSNVGNKLPSIVKPAMLAEWKELRKMCGPLTHIWQMDLPPNTTSADAWATVDGQTPLASEANRLEMNAWINDGCPLTPSLDLAAPGAVGAIRAGRRVNGVFVPGDEAHPLFATFSIAEHLTGFKANGDAVWKAGFAYPTDNLGIHLSGAGCAAAAVGLEWIKQYFGRR